MSADASSQGFSSIAASTFAESVTGLSDAAWLARASCDELALSPLPPQAASNRAGTSASIAYDTARGLEIRFEMKTPAGGCAQRSAERRVGKGCVGTCRSRGSRYH